MGNIGIWQLVVIVVIVVLLFGRGKISGLMGDVAQGIKSFKKGLADEDEPVVKAEEPKNIEQQAQAPASEETTSSSEKSD